MKSIERIFERYPNVKKKAINPNDTKVILTTQEAVFYQLVHFFNQPETVQFSINMIYEYLKDEDLLFAIESLVLFFQKDTQLVKNVSQFYYDSNLVKEEFVGQIGFSKMVEESIEGIKFKPSMIHVYHKRPTNRIPNADLIIDNTPYWTKKTVEAFIPQERKRWEEKQLRKRKKKDQESELPTKSEKSDK